MQGLISSRRGTALYLVVWLFLGAALGGVTVAAGEDAWLNAMIFAIPVTLVYSVSAGFSAYYICRAYPLAERAPFNVLMALGGAATLSALLWSAVVRAWNEACLLPGVPWAGIRFTPQLAILVFGLGVLLYGLLAAINYLVTEFERARGAERRELESRLMAQDAELRMLRTQIDPHFLFNSLNSISALTSQNARAAREMTLQLAGFFRQSLSMEAHKKVALDQEMALIRHFLAIEKVRFGERLELREEVLEGAGACLVPPMIIQPLVENAIKHGIAHLPEGGWMRVAARRAGSLLHICVENAVDAGSGSLEHGKGGGNGYGNVKGNGSGIGLANVRQRLACAYGHEASVHWSQSGDVFSVAIAMPAETKEEKICASS
ncbi:histidine kinase [Pseudoduganella sp. LjRoot289]|uniref:sensor histidine kinase n=1 Tax=Pseudoduganella sp. LjRoot289 TaxID=3342314 RepID=UPI003ECEE0E6